MAAAQPLFPGFYGGPGRRVLNRAAEFRDLLIREIGEALDKPLLAMIETAAGVLAAPAIAHEAAALVAGTNDLRADLRLPLDATREPITASLQMIVLAARAAGVPAYDCVFNRLNDPDGFVAEAEEGIVPDDGEWPPSRITEVSWQEPVERADAVHRAGGGVPAGPGRTD